MLNIINIDEIGENVYEEREVDPEPIKKNLVCDRDISLPSSGKIDLIKNSIIQEEEYFNSVEEQKSNLKEQLSIKFPTLDYHANRMMAWRS